MLLSDWYTNWKEKRIQQAVEEAKSRGYEEGYADGLSGTPNLKGIRLTRSRHTAGASVGEKSHTEKEK